MEEKNIEITLNVSLPNDIDIIGLKEAIAIIIQDYEGNVNFINII